MTKITKRYVSVLLHATKNNWLIGTIAIIVFVPLLFLFTGILGSYNSIPDWYPSGPVIFPPSEPLSGLPPFVSQYTFAWKLSEHSLMQINLTDSVWFLAIGSLFFLNIVLMAEVFRNKAKFSKLNWLAYPLALLGFVVCCGSIFTTFVFTVFGAGALFAIGSLIIYFRILAIALFGFNIWIMVRKLKNI